MPTPILDRERLASGKLAPQAGFQILGAFYGAVVTSVLFGWFEPFPTIRNWLQTVYLVWYDAELKRVGFIGFLAAFIASYYACVVIHELGHAIAGKAAGFRFEWLRVGPVVVRRNLTVKWERARGVAFNGAVAVLPVRTDHLARRGIVMALGGPLANILTVIALASVPLTHTMFTAYLVIYSALFGVSNLVPAETRIGTTDGGRILMLLRGDGRGERWLAMLQLHRDLSNGIRADQSDPSFFRIATAVRDGSIDTVMAYMFAFMRASQQGRHDEAGEYLETSLEYAVHAAPPFREAIRSEAALYQARRRNRPDLAAMWLEEIPEKSVRRWHRSRPEAAILAANGDVAGALAKLRDVEAEMMSQPPGGARQLALAELHEWQAELRSPAAASV